MYFIVSNLDKADSLALRMATRDAHLAYVRESGVVRLGGPYVDEAGQMTGSMLIIETADLAAAKAWAANDPYAKAGLFASSAVTAWKALTNFCDAKL